jgi:hypothetical protein
LITVISNALVVSALAEAANFRDFVHASMHGLLDRIPALNSDAVSATVCMTVAAATLLASRLLVGIGEPWVSHCNLRDADVGPALGSAGR